jgi:predicted enzyme related to lactoylglutathione lyase
MTQSSTTVAVKPIWTDIYSPDLDKSIAFYSGLFGWQAIDLGPDAGGYKMLALDGKVAAAIGPTSEGQYPAWGIYIGTDNADAVAPKVEAAGGKVAMAPFDVLGQGRMAVFQDPAGAFFSVWQPSVMKGFDVSMQPNSFGWAELNTPDQAGAEEFYPKVFGWGNKQSPFGPEMPGHYTEFQLDGASIAGCMDTATWEQQVPPMWLVYFIVSDIKATATKAKELGGQVMREPAPYPGGIFSIIMDTNNTVFGVIQGEDQA